VLQDQELLKNPQKTRFIYHISLLPGHQELSLDTTKTSAIPLFTPFSSTIESLSILCVEHHYCEAQQQWRTGVNLLKS